MVAEITALLDQWVSTGLASKTVDAFIAFVNYFSTAFTDLIKVYADILLK